MVRPWFVLLALSAACNFDAKFDGQFACDDDHPCPDGQTCGENGLCSGSGGDDGGGGDGDGGHGDGGAELACGTTSALRDDWSAQATTDLRWVCGGAIAVSDDTLRATLPADEEAYGECNSRRQYRLAASGITVSPETSDDEVEAALVLVLPSGVAYGMVRVEGKLHATRREGDDVQVLIEEPYDAEQHARWRMREANGDLLWETASEGGTFVELFSSDMDDLPAYVTVRLSGWGPDTRAEDGFVRFGPLNADVAVPLCEASSVVDQFSADADDEARWTTLGNDVICTQERSNGVLRIGSMGGLDRCGVGTRMGYDLSDDEVAVEAVTTGDGQPSLNFEVLGADGRWYRFRVSGDPKDLVAESGGSGNSSNKTATLSEGDHRYWRFRHDGGSMLWEVSADGEAWSVYHEREGVVEPSDMQIQMYGISLGALDPTIVELDDLNRVNEPR